MKRRDKALASMVISGLFEKNGKCTDTLEQVLENNFSGLSLDLLRNELENKNIASSCRR